VEDYGMDRDHGKEKDVSDPKIFYVIFELVSAFGNVGLSMGSLKSNSSSFSSDLNWASLILVMLVEILGRTRELPNQLDGALEMARPAKPEEYLRSSFIEQLHRQQQTESAATKADSTASGTPLAHDNILLLASDAEATEPATSASQRSKSYDSDGDRER
jgi:hypothetical protein